MRSSSGFKASATASRITNNDFNPLEYERPGVSIDEVREMKDAFDLFDPHRTGFASTQCNFPVMKNCWPHSRQWDQTRVNSPSTL